MAAPLQAFESVWQKDIEKKQRKEARERYLEKAETEFNKREKKKEDARKRGEGTWMLPALSERIDKDELAAKRSKVKKQKKDKKEKKKKSEKEKSKKRKKKKKEKDEESDDSSSDSSDSESDGQVEWVAKSNVAPSPATTVGPKLERQDWMVDPLADIFGGVTRDEIKAQKKKDAGEEEEEKPSVIDQMGQHDRELNPYWRDGGKGLPEEAPAKKAKKDRSAGGAGPGGVAGDGGLSWLRRSHQRCVEAAQEEGRTVEEVAAERYGSLKKLEKMIAEAEKKNKAEESRSRGGWERDRDWDRNRDRDSDRDRERDRGRDRDRERGSSGPASRFMRPGEMSGAGSGGNSQSRQRTFMRPGGDGNDQPQRRKMAFMKPGEEGESSRPTSSSASDRQGWRKRDDNVPRWKKAKVEDEDGCEGHRGRDRDRSRSTDRDRDRKRDRSRDRSRDRDRNRRDRSRSRSRDRSRDRDRGRDRSRSKERDSKRKRSRSRSRSRDRDRRRSHDSSASSSDSSSDSESESEPPESESESEPEPEPVKVLTEDELNALGAKILRAELMGNEEAAASLKAQLEEARKVKAEAGSRAPVREKKPSDTGDKVVVLTRTDRAGNVRPVPEAKHERGEGGRRRKKEKVATHAKEGHRERYFADDDKHNLSDLVRQEKMSTAEDSNAMFARLAGRSIEKTDEDHQIDDVMVNRANKKMSDAKVEENDRSAAIFEHRQMSKALDKCKFCFDNIPKHLIIAIGIKVYLCLPAHRSMVPGHCLIVPMQHAISGTAVDDDVWAEIQVFRKGLTAMFREQEEDVVFMETSMHLRHFPHMVVECVPIPREVGEMAPIYFKKAIQESDTEWSQNKKLIDLSKKNVRASVPKGFPYFSVDFGLHGGFAHVIEDEQIFPSYFGREIAGGMMDIEPMLWRKPHKEEFEQQRQKVLKFAAWWKPYDWTQKLKAQEESDSD